MIVSWDWLKQYVRLDVSAEELAERLTMAGLNHESTREVAGDRAIDLEVTSNRPDCLGHIGVAREAAVLLGQLLRLPDVSFGTGRPGVADLAGVEVQAADLCPRYVARVIRGVRVGPSPDWLRRQLATCGVASINNVVDVTNYVLLEAGQPLHAFDYDKLAEHRIIVRRARRGETIQAINQKRYELSADQCVIADARRPVAVAGIMGGFETEVSGGTTNLLIESAEFDPLSVRRTSRALALSSDSSYRFVRGVDPAGVDWASRRCCQLITEVAGGVAAEGAITVGPPLPERAPVALRHAQIERILGITVPPEKTREILGQLGLEELRHDNASVTVRPPSWRRDLEREIDLVEEVARIHGYERIPEDAEVPMTTATRTPRERVHGILREALGAAGFSEAVTLSFVDQPLADAFRLWSPAAPLSVDHPSRRQENLLRPSLLPSLLAARRLNESRGTRTTELYELARVYLRGDTAGSADEPVHLALVSGRGVHELKGVIELLLERLHAPGGLTAEPIQAAEFAAGQGARLRIGDRLLGYLGQVSDALAARFDLRTACSVAELDVAPLGDVARLVPRYQPIPGFPSSERELSLILDEAVPWARVEEAVRSAAGDHLESIRFFDIYHGRPIPAGKKSLHFGITYRSPERTLTREEVDAAQQAVIAVCRARFGAELRGA